MIYNTTISIFLLSVCFISTITAFPVNVDNRDISSKEELAISDSSVEDTIVTELFIQEVTGTESPIEDAVQIETSTKDMTQEDSSLRETTSTESLLHNMTPTESTVRDTTATEPVIKEATRQSASTSTEETTTQSVHTEILMEDIHQPLSSQNIEIRFHPQTLHPVDHSKGDPSSKTEKQTVSTDDVHDSLEEIKHFQSWPRVRAANHDDFGNRLGRKYNSTIVRTMTHSSVSVSTTVHKETAATPRKIVGFVNLPLRLSSSSDTKDSMAYPKIKLNSDHSSPLKDILPSAPQWLYGPIKDVRKTLQSYGIPSTEGWLELAKVGLDIQSPKNAVRTTESSKSEVTDIRSTKTESTTETITHSVESSTLNQDDLIAVVVNHEILKTDQQKIPEIPVSKTQNNNDTMETLLDMSTTTNNSRKDYAVSEISIDISSSTTEASPSISTNSAQLNATENHDEIQEMFSPSVGPQPLSEDIPVAEIGNHETHKTNHGSPDLNHIVLDRNQQEEIDKSVEHHHSIEQDLTNRSTESPSKLLNGHVELDDEDIEEEEDKDEIEEDPVGFMEGEMDGHKYQVEEKTPDGYIVGEFGIVNRSSGSLRGVRYTAHGSINPQLIKAALRTFLSL